MDTERDANGDLQWGPNFPTGSSLGDRERGHETKTYAALVSGSVRSELDETCYFGRTTFPSPPFLVEALIVQLLRIVDIVKTIPHEQRENTICIGRKRK